MASAMYCSGNRLFKESEATLGQEKRHPQYACVQRADVEPAIATGLSLSPAGLSDSPSASLPSPRESLVPMCV